MTILFDGPLMADYHQVYIADVAAQADLPTRWTDHDVHLRVLTSAGAFVFSTARNMPVPVRVTLHDSEPPLPPDADHVVVGSFRTSGRIVIAGLTDDVATARRATVPAGTLCAMAVSSGLDTLSDDGLDGRDRYEVSLWPCAGGGTVVRRQWQGE